MKDDLDSKTAVKSSKNQLKMSSFTTSVSFTKDLFKKAYLQWIVNNNLPLTAGEAPAFVSMIKSLNKTVSVPDYKMTSTQKLKSYLNSKFYSVTCDHWTSMPQENYGALTLHLIDNFQLKTFVLCCRKHPNGASAAELESQLTSDLGTWGLEKNSFSLLLLIQYLT
jgi:hypothetical protein